MLYKGVCPEVLLEILSIGGVALDVDLEPCERLAIDTVADILGVAFDVGVAQNGIGGDPSIVDGLVVDVARDAQCEIPSRSAVGAENAEIAWIGQVSG